MTARMQLAAAELRMLGLCKYVFRVPNGGKYACSETDEGSAYTIYATRQVVANLDLLPPI